MKKKFELANLSKSLLYCFCISICALNLTACDDDDENGTQGNGPAPIGIPSSVIDGVRATSMSGVDVTYNEDGTIKEAEVDGGSRWKHSCFQLCLFACNKGRPYPLFNQHHFIRT